MANTPYKKKLIEVAIPLEAINKASAKERDIRWHPRVLHRYWARRPLAACRAVLFAQLVDDPSTHSDKFPTPEDQQKERARLFQIMEELVLWKNITNEEVLKRARDEILKSCDGELPPIYDPFSGGGSIPLEALRLGLPAYGSDLNPVAVMIGKALIEIPPMFQDMKPIHPGRLEKMHYKNADGLAEDVQYYGEWMQKKAFESIGHLYPEVDLPKEQGGGKATVIAWIWARTVPSPDPAFTDANVPIASTFLLSSQAGKEVLIEPIINRDSKSIEYKIVTNGSQEQINRAKIGTKSGRGANFTCLLSKAAIDRDYVKKCGKTGRISAQLIGVYVAGNSGRIYLPPDEISISAANIKRVDAAQDIPLPQSSLNIRVIAYGFKNFSDLYTNRQIILLQELSSLVKEVHHQIYENAISSGLTSEKHTLESKSVSALSYAEAVRVYLGLGVSKLSDLQNNLVSWRSSTNQARNLFTRQAISMIWDFAEPNVFGNSPGSFNATLRNICQVLRNLAPASAGVLDNQDAQTVNYPVGAVFSTDPPYYDNIGYANISDFFFLWMKQTLKPIYPDVFNTLATPKSEELVADKVRHDSKHKAERFFLGGMRKVISNIYDQDTGSAPVAIYYAFKQSEVEKEGVSSTGWATFLEAVIESGYSIVGTWPMQTELATRMGGIRTNSLANSVVLVCRKRETTSGTITRAEFIRQLKSKLPKAITELKAANISPADIPQSSIGPGIGIFSHYKAVLEADDSPMSVKTALQLVNRELGDEKEDYDAETSFAIAWFEQNGFNVGNFGTANNIANAKGIAVDALVHAGVAQSSGGKFRLLNRDSLEEGWNPLKDDRITVWECLQYLIRRMENKGEFEAAKLMKRIGMNRANAAKELAYSLYDIAANKRKNAAEANAYNGLIAVWSDLTVLAANITDKELRGDLQGQLI